jgi:hypothetical protein
MQLKSKLHTAVANANAGDVGMQKSFVGVLACSCSQAVCTCSSYSRGVLPMYHAALRLCRAMRME